MTIQDLSLRKEIRELTPLHKEYPERLRNTPVVPDSEAIRKMYLSILGRK